jgi:membrane-associated protease RseP (regulator of RpoE activity)
VEGQGHNLLQIDASPAAGSAGAPVINEQGLLIGVIGLTGRVPNVGFAVPAVAVQRTIDARRGNEKHVARRAVLGLSFNSEPENAIVSDLVPGAPAAAAGIVKGDQVVSVDGENVGSTPELVHMMLTKSVGQTVKVSIRRDGKVQEFEVRLDSLPGETSATGEKTNPTESALKKYRTYTRQQVEYVTRFVDGKPVTVPVVRPVNVNVPTIQVERSDLDKKLEALSRDLNSMREQMEKLTDELKRMEKLNRRAPGE